MSINLEVLSGQTQVSCSNPAPAQEYSDPPLLIGFTNLQLAGSSIYQEYCPVSLYDRLQFNILICSVFSVLFRSSHLTNPHFLPAFQSIPPTRTGTVNPQNKSPIHYISWNRDSCGIVTMRKC